MLAWTELRARYPLILALIGPLAAAALMIPLRSHVQNTDLALAMVVVVALAVLPGWRIAAVAAGLSAGAWFDFFLTRPYERFSIQRSSDVQTTVLLAVVGILRR
jgi:K+-sensing histidine kinase KdpD